MKDNSDTQFVIEPAKARIVKDWVAGNLSNRTMQEALGLPESERE